MKHTSRDEMTCTGCPIRHAAVCSLCEPDELAALEKIKTYRNFGPGETLFEAGQQMRHVGTVVQGVVTLSRTLEDGRRQITGLLLPSDFIGRPWRSDIAFDVTAAAPVTLCRFDRGAFEKILAVTPHIGERMLAMTLDDLDAARDWAVVLGRLAARERIAAFLMVLLRRMGRPLGRDGRAFELPLTREAMADALGLTLETASRQMSHLRRGGVIETEGRATIRVPDIARLQEEACEDDDGAPLA